jgi:hypothetical protein
MQTHPYDKLTLDNGASFVQRHFFTQYNVHLSVNFTQ